MSIYLTGATYIDWQTLEQARGILEVAGGSTRFVDHFRARPGDRVLDCTGCYVTRSFACAHHHSYAALARGMPGPAARPGSFAELLEQVWWRLDRALDLESVRVSALVTAAACLKSGVTFLIDHHSSPRAIAGSLETAAAAFEEAGVGHLLCYELSDRNGEESARAALEESDRYLSSRQGLVGLHASFTVGEPLLRQAVELARARGTGIHVHVAEDAVDERLSLERYGRRVAERFDAAGVLASPKTILAHCLHLDAGEWSLLDRSPAWVAQNSESNLNNAVGNFEAKGARERVMLGTDGMHSDMIREARTAFLVGQAHIAQTQVGRAHAAQSHAGRARGGLSAEGAYRRLRNVHRYLREGGFQGDGEDNLVVFAYDPPTEITPSNFPSHLLFGVEPRNVRAVISSGRLVMLEGRPLTLDEREVMAEAREAAAGLWSRMRQLGGQ